MLYQVYLLPENGKDVINFKQTLPLLYKFDFGNRLENVAGIGSATVIYEQKFAGCSTRHN